MKIPRAPHAWKVTPTRAVAIQQQLASRVIPKGRLSRARLIAGADLAFTKDRASCIAGVVVWDLRTKQVVEEQIVRQPVAFPYVPGLLSFREAPALVAAFRKLSVEPDAFMFDGQGFAHPRRFGLACHVGVLLDRPSLGCAKSILIGGGDAPAWQRGSTAPLVHKEQTIGESVRTRDGVRPVYVSIGHRMSLQAAVGLTLQCSTRYRIPEPTRLADKLVADVRRS